MNLIIANGGHVEIWDALLPAVSWNRRLHLYLGRAESLVPREDSDARRGCSSFAINPVQPV